MSPISSPVLYKWAIYLVGDRGVFVGSVDAQDEKSAISAAIEVFGITEPEQQKHLIARRSQKT